jgi:mono/diheme cytochrome c family protein
MKNPVKSDATSLAEGKELWSKHCQSCHGKTGLGDGTKAAQLKTEPGNFTKADVQSQSDGSLFYKSSEGRDDMPSFKKKIPDEEERWSIINYIRTLKK